MGGTYPSPRQKNELRLDYEDSGWRFKGRITMVNPTKGIERQEVRRSDSPVGAQRDGSGKG